MRNLLFIFILPIFEIPTVIGHIASNQLIMILESPKNNNQEKLIHLQVIKIIKRQ